MAVAHHPLRELTAVFLRLDSTSLGGPAAHIALMRHQVVERHPWMTDEEYARLIALAHHVPGPNSTEVAIHVGRLRAGWKGLLVAGIAFIAPAFVLMLGLAWLYEEYDARPRFQSILAGIAPVVAVLAGRIGNGRTGAGGGPLVVAVSPPFHHLGRVAPVVATAGSVMLAPLLLVFLQIGAVLHGSGYVLDALLEAELVDDRG